MCASGIQHWGPCVPFDLLYIVTTGGILWDWWKPWMNLTHLYPVLVFHPLSIGWECSVEEGICETLMLLLALQEVQVQMSYRPLCVFDEAMIPSARHMTSICTMTHLHWCSFLHHSCISRISRRFLLPMKCMRLLSSVLRVFMLMQNAVEFYDDLVMVHNLVILINCLLFAAPRGLNSLMPNVQLMETQGSHVHEKWWTECSIDIHDKGEMISWKNWWESKHPDLLSTAHICAIHEISNDSNMHAMPPCASVDIFTSSLHCSSWDTSWAYSESLPFSLNPLLSS